MAGRESRARLLLPSFLVVTAALACGQTRADDFSTDDESEHVGGSGGSNGGTSGSMPIVAGAGANPPYPLACPTEPPTSGQGCSQGFGFYAGSCEYPGRPGSCGFATSATKATCEAGTWRVEPGVVAEGCTPLMPLSCPPTLPAIDAPCDYDGAAFYPEPCDYDGAAFYPEPCAYATQQCAKLSVSCVTGRWQLGACAPPVCPQKPPEQSSACSEDYRGTSCDYTNDGACRVTAGCSETGWQVERDCSIAQGGAGGESGARSAGAAGENALGGAQN